MKVGITGHQDISRYNLNWIIIEIEGFLKSNTIEKGYSSLAIGSDQLFVKTLLKLKIDFDAIIPCSNYELTFKNQEDLLQYNTFLNAASNIQTLNYSEPSEQAFYDAGKRIIDLSDTILAVWDGEKAKGLGGTGDIVEKAVQNKKKFFI